MGEYTLWQGRDHLLHIYSRFGVEGYKRFYYNDIQAIITRKTGVGRNLSIILGILIGLFSFLAISLDGGGSVFFGSLVGGLFILMLVNVLKGPTCETHLLTAVQNEKLQSLDRLKKTLRVMNRLKPIIKSVQRASDPVSLDPRSNQPTETGSPLDFPSRAGQGAGV